MGTYGVEWFENDAVADWLGEMEAEGRADQVRTSTTSQRADW